MKKYKITFAKTDKFTVMALTIEEATQKALDILGKKYGYISKSVRDHYLSIN